MQHFQSNKMAYSHRHISQRRCSTDLPSPTETPLNLCYSVYGAPATQYQNSGYQQNFLSNFQLQAAPMKYSPYPRPSLNQPSSSIKMMEYGCHLDPNRLATSRARVRACDDKAILRTVQSGETILHIALITRDEPLQAAVMEAMENRPAMRILVNKPNDKRQTPLFIAAISGQHYAMKTLLCQHSADPNILALVKVSGGKSDSISALHYCASYGTAHLESLTALLKSPLIDVNIRSASGVTPLHLSVWKHNATMVNNNPPINNLPSIRALLDGKASPLATDRSGRTALHYAVERACVTTIEMLLSHSRGKGDEGWALVEQRDYRGFTPLHVAASLHSHPEVTQLAVIEVLLRYGANRLSLDNFKKQPKDYVHTVRSQVYELMHDPASVVLTEQTDGELTDFSSTQFTLDD